MDDGNVTESTTTNSNPTATTTSTRRRRSASRAAGPPAATETPSTAAGVAAGPVPTEEVGEPTPAPRPRRSRAKKAAPVAAQGDGADSATSARADIGQSESTPPRERAERDTPADSGEVAAAAPDKPARRPRKKSAAASPRQRSGRASAAGARTEEPAEPTAASGDAAVISAETTPGVASAPAVPLLFQAPQFTAGEAPARPVRKRVVREAPAETDTAPIADEDDADEAEADGAPRRRRRRGGRGRRKKGGGETPGADDGEADDGQAGAVQTGAGERSDAVAARDNDGGADQGSGEESDDDAGVTRRRRRRRRRRGDSDSDEMLPDDPPDTVVRVREPRSVDDTSEEVTSVKGSTRLEAKKQRRRDGREAGRRRPPAISEAEFLARREAVDRVMVVRQTGDRIQIGVLEDNVLVEHYVSRSSQQSMVGNVYLGRVQNVLPAMEAAFVDIGRGRNAILYAGEVDWAGLGKPDGPRRIEEVLKSGQSVLVQVTKDPIGHKGSRLTGQVSLPGRYVVFVPGGAMSGISRKLPDTERTRLKRVLKDVVPDDSGVIVRTAAEGASEEELTHDVGRLRAQWEDIVAKRSGSAPQLLYSEPDLAIKVVRDLFNEDFSSLVVSGDDAWDTIEPYVSYVASSLRDRVQRWSGDGDVFAAHRIDEQIAKALDRKVWLPSGGSLVIDRTEAMTVVDVNTGKFTGSGGNLEETVTKNNLEAAEEIVRQLRLRDIGGIIVIDFIDMVLEANRDLVLRRLVECLGRDRTKHQVAEVTSLGLVQMTRKRIGTDLLEAFSEPCETCKGRGVIIHHEPVDSAAGRQESGSDAAGAGRRGRRRRGERTAPSEPVMPAAVVEHVTPVEPAAATSADELAEAETPTVDVLPAGAAEAGSADGRVPVGGTPATESAEGPATEGATPRRRPRRRAQRPAGEPDARAEQVGAAG
ncbi:MAG TPA: Rne/Rng family ribonuclease [Jiangellaceae bacterium]|nr:Rne/Rng family ribonuclease [Jiangellaceae bacterium]